MKYYVYAYFEPERSEPFYIGKGCGRRLYHHLQPAMYLKHQTPFYKKIRSLLASGFRPDIQILSDGLTESEASQLEIQLISKFGRRDLGTGCLLNVSEGGLGQSHSLETRQKLSTLSKGRRHTEETKQKMSKTRSSKEYLLRRGKPIVGILFGKVVFQYLCINQCEENGFSRHAIQRALKENGIAYGYFWKYQNDSL